MRVGYHVDDRANLSRVRYLLGVGCSCLNVLVDGIGDETARHREGVDEHSLPGLDYP